MTEELGNKFNMKNVDFSVIRKALQASGKMVEQIIDGIHCGSTEIRHLILEESDIIIECKICRNLFRALPNFVAHKGIYCLDSFVSVSKVPSTYCPSSEDVVIVEPEPPDDAREFVKNLADGTSDYQNEPKATDPKPVAKNSDCAKISQKSCRRKPNLLLQKLTEISSGEKSSCEKKKLAPASESSKSNNLTTPKETGNAQQELVLKSQLADYRQLKCRKCNRKLSSRNSLSHHIVNLHAQRKRLYSCPYCGKVKGKFRYIGGVVRHLGTAHNLKKYQIDKLRKKVKENSWFEDNLMEQVQPVLSSNDKNDLNDRKTNQEDPNQLKLKIKIVSDSETNKKLSYEMVRNDSLNTPDENQTESDKEKLDLTLSKMPSLEEEASEPFCTPLPLADEPEQNSKSEDQILENSDLSDEVASEISEKDSVPDVECEMEVSQVSETNDSGNGLSPACPSVRLSPPHLSEVVLEPPPTPTTLEASMVLTLKAASSFEEFPEQELEAPSESETAIPQLVMEQQSQTPSIEAVSTHSDDDPLEEKPELKPEETLTPPKLYPPQTVTLEPTKTEPFLNNSPFPGDSSSMLKPRSARSRMLFVCEHCKKCFGQKKTLDDHARLCSEWVHQPKPSSISESQKPKVVPKLENKKDKKDFKIEPKKAIRRNVEKPADCKQVQLPKPNNTNCSVERYDKKKVLAMIDGKALKCLDCNQKFSNQSHLRRHAVRHLGWRRFKCKLCKFTSYDKSETKTHIKRCHLGKTHGLTTKSVDYYIADLKAENSKTHSKKSSEKSPIKSSKSHSTKKSDNSLGNFNGTKCKASISDSQDSQLSTKCNKNEKRLCVRIVTPQAKTIRTSPRKPVPKIDKMSSLFIKKY